MYFQNGKHPFNNETATIKSNLIFISIRKIAQLVHKLFVSAVHSVCILFKNNLLIVYFIN